MSETYSNHQECEPEETGEATPSPWGKISTDTQPLFVWDKRGILDPTDAERETRAQLDDIISRHSVGMDDHTD